MQGSHAFGFRAERDFMDTRKPGLQIDLKPALAAKTTSAPSVGSFDLPSAVTPPIAYPMSTQRLAQAI